MRTRRRRAPPRRSPPASPGGHVDPSETSRAAAVREHAEETGVHMAADDLRQPGVWVSPERDPHGSSHCDPSVMYGEWPRHPGQARSVRSSANTCDSGCGPTYCWQLH
ncbi:NUDIX hydrolase [Streptomyces sp. NPDC048664]|uniref:NUDIX hydrolase n=1 Tax=Streptomyces sp. NPDC048664 TaxID=3154505 RepID=UPI00343885AF